MSWKGSYPYLLAKAFANLVTTVTASAGSDASMKIRSPLVGFHSWVVGVLADGLLLKVGLVVDDLMVLMAVGGLVVVEEDGVVVVSRKLLMVACLSCGIMPCTMTTIRWMTLVHDNDGLCEISIAVIQVKVMGDGSSDVMVMVQTLLILWTLVTMADCFSCLMI